ncbi:MAG: amidohydrolase family protein [Verrucomicrobiales bacterium]|nr:amidohydrolase family protein [Verrucomicrobiales bacterium]
MRRSLPTLARRFAILATLCAGILLLARQVFFHGPYQPVTQLPGHGIVDLHCHTAGIGAGGSGCFVSARMRANVRYRIYLESFGVTEEEISREGDALVIRKLSESVARSEHVRAAVVLALDGVVDSTGSLDTNRTEVYVPTEFVAREVSRTTNLLLGASIHPRRTDALERLDRAAAEGAVLVKWIPSIMDIDPADPAYVPFYRRLVHHRLPLLSHTGNERSFTSAQDALADPERLRLPLEHGVTIIAAHAGAAGNNGGEADLLRLRRLMQRYPNLYADISALTQVNRLGALRETLEAPECRGRLVYGSDFPLINTALVSPWYYPLNLTEQQRRTLAAVGSPWDRDVLLKQALGVPAEIFIRGETLLPSVARRNSRADHP